MPHLHNLAADPPASSTGGSGTPLDVYVKMVSVRVCIAYVLPFFVSLLLAIGITTTQRY